MKGRVIRLFSQISKYLRDERYRSAVRWFRENPNNELLFKHDLELGANVLDVGGYNGDFAAEIFKRYKANVFIVEPVVEFADKIEKRFSSNPFIRVFKLGLADSDGVFDFFVDGDSSTAVRENGGARTKVIFRDVKKFLDELNIDNWDLMKINIEGSEYDLLNRLINTGRIQQFHFLLVQFHLFVPGAKQKYWTLTKHLSHTHKLCWRYPFIWELWERREK